MHTDRPIIQTYKKADIQTEIQADIQTTWRYSKRHTDRHTDKHTDRHTDRDTYRHTYRRKDISVYRVASLLINNNYGGSGNGAKIS